MNNLKVALVHDWLNGMRGGEKVLEVLCELFPQSDIYTLLYDKEKVSSVISQKKVQTSFIQKLPLFKKYYRYYLPFFPSAIEKIDLSGKKYDLVISTSHCVAKGIIPPSGVPHISYCFTPMRYVWALQDEYLGKGLKRLIASPFIRRLRKWDQRTASRVNRFIAISRHVADRINRFYLREADVIYPPVDTSFFNLSQSKEKQKEDYFLIVSALVPYKRIDLAIEAFNELKLPLRIIGAGNMLNKLKAQVQSNIEFLGWQSNDLIREHYQKARALIFPGEEDFGIVPLEAMACGTPVIAYEKGGVLETVMPLKETASEPATGLFFKEATSQSLQKAVQQFIVKENQFNPNFLREHAEKFNRERFKQQIQSAVQQQLAKV